MILGCDPGITGAFALYDGQALQVLQMPTVKRPAGQRNTLRAFINRGQVLDALMNFRLQGAKTLVIEKVGGMPGQAAHSAFVFGHGAGGVTYAADGMGYRVEEVPAMTWKSALKVPSDKTKAIARASDLLPAWAGCWSGGSLEARSGRAEAALIAFYGWQVFA